MYNIFIFQFCKAIFWLAQSIDDVPLPYCTTAENVVYKYLTDELWEKFEFYEKNTDEVTGMKMVSRVTFYLIILNDIFFLTPSFQI
jgi:hypothetical protein